jgi:hypothetical protein
LLGVWSTKNLGGQKFGHPKLGWRQNFVQVQGNQSVQFSVFYHSISIRDKACFLFIHPSA